jgi:hypothetical protein
LSVQCSFGDPFDCRIQARAVTAAGKDTDFDFFDTSNSVFIYGNKLITISKSDTHLASGKFSVRFQCDDDFVNNIIQ